MTPCRVTDPSRGHCGETGTREGRGTDLTTGTDTQRPGEAPPCDPWVVRQSLGVVRHHNACPLRPVRHSHRKNVWGTSTGLVREFSMENSPRKFLLGRKKFRKKGVPEES